MRAFDAPSPNWNRGHRGVDLAGVPGQPVDAAGAGTVVFAGELAGPTLVSIAHPGGLPTGFAPPACRGERPKWRQLGRACARSAQPRTRLPSKP
jgi:hypothetical protein